MLKEKGFRATPGRLQILLVLSNEKKPVTVTRLFELIGKELDPVTLYRALEAFEEKGIVKRIDLGHSHAHYEFAAGGHHHHLVCTNCSRVEDVEVCLDEKVEKQVLARSAHFKKINEHALEFFGLCRTCVK